MLATEGVIARFRRWYRMAEAAGEPRGDAMALATLDGRGGVSVRMVLVKQVDQRGFVFFTCRNSRKGKDLAARARAAATFHWPLITRQVRIEGRVEPVTAAEADDYWSTRPRGSQLSAAVSRQSQPIGSRAELARRRAGLRSSAAGRCRARRSGAAIASCPTASSSGRSARIASTTASSSSGRRAVGS